MDVNFTYGSKSWYTKKDDFTAEVQFVKWKKMEERDPHYASIPRIEFQEDDYAVTDAVFSDKK